MESYPMADGTNATEFPSELERYGWTGPSTMIAVRDNEIERANTQYETNLCSSRAKCRMLRVRGNCKRTVWWIQATREDEDNNICDKTCKRQLALSIAPEQYREPECMSQLHL